MTINGFMEKVEKKTHIEQTKNEKCQMEALKKKYKMPPRLWKTNATIKLLNNPVLRVSGISSYLPDLNELIEFRCILVIHTFT